MPETVGLRLAQIKLRLGLTTSALASLLGRPTSSVQHWLRGHVVPRGWPEEVVAALEAASPDSPEVMAARATHPDNRGRRSR